MNKRILNLTRLGVNHDFATKLVKLFVAVKMSAHWDTCCDTDYYEIRNCNDSTVEGFTMDFIHDKKADCLNAIDTAIIAAWIKLNNK